MDELEGIKALKKIIKEYQDKGHTFDDFCVGIKGAYREQHPYTKYTLPKYKEGANLDVAKLKADLEQAGYKTIRDIWDEECVI